jgi:hypothetical protein
MKPSRLSFALSVFGLAALLVLPAPVVTAVAQLSQADAPVSKTPVVVYILRHAEKPVGEGKDPNLTPQGFERAHAIPSLFMMAPGATQPARFPRPDSIFATETSKASNRPIETITPLAQALHLKINHDFADLETGPLARELLSGKYAGKVVVIAWHHGEIPHLAQALGVAKVPKKWDPDVFDQIWQIRWVDGEAQLTILPQRLLPGDSKQ